MPVLLKRSVRKTHSLTCGTIAPQDQAPKSPHVISPAFDPLMGGTAPSHFFSLLDFQQVRRSAQKRGNVPTSGTRPNVLGGVGVELRDRAFFGRLFDVV